MKNISGAILISLFPLLTPMTASAVPAAPIAGAKGSAASWRASQVTGLDMKSSGDELIGKVEDLVLDMKNGEILAVVISSGGFLGLADTLSAVPISALRYDDLAKAFKTKLTKEQLGKAPQFKNDTWPDYREATSIEAMRSYRDSIGGDVTQPDNSAQNDEATGSDTTDPTDQGNSAKDLQITKDIRSGIMGSELSFNAKNVKVITLNEHVTLKGVVGSDAEHKAILKIAGNHANSGKITGGLIGLGIPEIEAKRYENRIAEGNILISVLTVSGDDVNRAKELLAKAGAENISVRSIGELASSAKG